MILCFKGFATFVRERLFSTACELFVLLEVYRCRSISLPCRRYSVTSGLYSLPLFDLLIHQKCAGAKPMPTALNLSVRWRNDRYPDGFPASR